jgi:hypothetical protein
VLNVTLKQTTQYSFFFPLKLHFTNPFSAFLYYKLFNGKSGEFQAYTECVSESGYFSTLFFFWFDNIGADAAISIFLPTLKRFSCNEAVDWCTNAFAVKEFHKTADSFVIA